MKTKTKTFDCVQMKREIQAARSEADAGLTAEERISAMKARIMKGPFAHLWQAGEAASSRDEKAA